MGELPNELIPIHRTQNRGVVNRRPQMEHFMWGRRSGLITIVVMTLLLYIHTSVRFRFGLDHRFCLVPMNSPMSAALSGSHKTLQPPPAPAPPPPPRPRSPLTDSPVVRLLLYLFPLECCRLGLKQETYDYVWSPMRQREAW